MKVSLENSFNPNPITKFLVVVLLGFTIIHSIALYLQWSVVILISVMYFLNSLRSEAVKNIITFGILSFIQGMTYAASFPLAVKMIISLALIFKIFYIPFAAGKFLIKTSDVGSIISSMDYVKIPTSISIPISVMFRFFPSFKEERKNIKMAMKIRGIKIKNPIKYMEYVAIPLLMISSNIAEDIAKAAETKAIGNPGVKTRYIKVGIKPVDFIYAITVILILLGGWVC